MKYSWNLKGPVRSEPTRSVWWAALDNLQPAARRPDMILVLRGPVDVELLGTEIRVWLRGWGDS